MYGDLYQGKTVFVTGHTGFKGSWLSIWLTMLGAKVVGYALDPTSDRSTYSKSDLKSHLHADLRGDIRDEESLMDAISKYQPDMVFHLAAQPLVRVAYNQPKYTYETNLMGSLNVLECVRRSDTVSTAIMITSDKCYENIEQLWGYRENDRMGGYDPYSSSKGCAELMIASYRNSFMNPSDHLDHGKAIASVRAGNVIGGGDWSQDRLIPDCIRAIEANREIEIRSPHATRPWEHVLEPLSGYLRLGQLLLEDPTSYSEGFNFGPGSECNRTVLEVVQYLVEYYGKGSIRDVSNSAGVHENMLLSLDVTKAKRILGWEAKLSLREAIEYTVDWYKKSLHDDPMFDFCVSQIMAHAAKGYAWEGQCECGIS